MNFPERRGAARLPCRRAWCNLARCRERLRCGWLGSCGWGLMCSTFYDSGMHEMRRLKHQCSPRVQVETPKRVPNLVWGRPMVPARSSSSLALLLTGAAAAPLPHADGRATLQAQPDASSSPVVLALILSAPSTGMKNPALWEAWLANATRSGLKFRMFVNTYNSSASIARQTFRPASMRPHRPDGDVAVGCSHSAPLPTTSLRHATRAGVTRQARRYGLSRRMSPRCAWSTPPHWMVTSAPMR